MLTVSATYSMEHRQLARRCFGCEKPFSQSNLIRGYCKHCAPRIKERFYCPECNKEWTADWISVEWAVKCEINYVEPCFSCKGLLQAEA